LFRRARGPRLTQAVCLLHLCYAASANHLQEERVAKYSRSAGKDVKRAMHKRKKGTLKSGKGGKGGKVKSRKQAIAIGLSEARKKGKKVPQKKSSKKRSSKKRKSSKRKSKK
jgi:Family of unknown function (DUF6496)